MLGAGLRKVCPPTRPAMGSRSGGPAGAAAGWVEAMIMEPPRAPRPRRRRSRTPQAAHALLGEPAQPPPRGLEPAVDVAVGDARGDRSFRLLAQQRHR